MSSRPFPADLATRPVVDRRLLVTCLVLAIAGTGHVAIAIEYSVSSAADIASRLPSLQPGDALVMTNGTWTNQQIQFAGIGNSIQPITLRAETPGQVVLSGNSSLNISGDWLHVEGLNFEGGALGSGDHVVEFRGLLGAATNSRFTNSAIINYNPPNINTRYFWVSLYGEHNRVDHNFFQGQNHSGVTAVVWRDSPAADHHKIDHNHFADRPEGNDNGWETIRVGTSDESLSDSFTVVENNLFERTDGEIEIISNKSGHNTYRYNTFRESAGTLTLRHGNDNRVEGNFFLGDGKYESGGVRVIGERQTIVNNYFGNLDGRADGAISISAGVPDSRLNEYYQVKDAVIAHNTVVDVKEAAIKFDQGLGSSGRTMLAENVTVANNLIRSTQDPLFAGQEGPGWTWEGNLAYGESLGPAAGNPGITVIDPQLQLNSNGIWRPAPGSPAVDGSASDYSGLIVDDMDGQPRVGMFDVGADEFSLATIVRKPLRSGDVGPDWLVTDAGGCGHPLAIQAENFSIVLDPDGNGSRWIVTAAAEALGGESLRAPFGDRVDLPGELQDTIAVYEVAFDEPGTYTAYFRARGYDTGTDSIFVPGDFNVDPNIDQTLSSDGIYRWETGQQFIITAADVDVPLEFRIGMREQLADFDALVFDLNSNLAASELDALFNTACPDFNGDGAVDCADVHALVAEIISATHGSGFDLTGDGLVDRADLDEWLVQAGSINLPGGGAYLSGDANLDGVVDGSDFNVWNSSKFTASAAWCSGDFTADGLVDASDFNAWNANKFLASDTSPATVPEPGVGLLHLLAMILGSLFARRHVGGGITSHSRMRLTPPLS